jgi:hypothetical protein
VWQPFTSKSAETVLEPLDYSGTAAKAEAVGQSIVEGVDPIRAGYNVFMNIEKLQFSDREINVSGL